MAIFDHERKNGIQMGTVGDECIECRRKRVLGEDYEPVRLDYQEVYKFWINNHPHCLCMNCFKASLGKYMLVDSTELDKPEEDKKSAAKKTTAKKKEGDKNGSETA